MIIEIHLETKFPDIYINGVGLFRHWWHHIKYAYYVLMIRISEDIIQSFEEEDVDGKELDN